VSDFLRVLFWLPLIFLLSYLAVGALLALIAAIWPWLLAAVGAVLVIAKVLSYAD
jgi:hypothetical protein